MEAEERKVEEMKSFQKYVTKIALSTSLLEPKLNSIFYNLRRQLVCVVGSAVKAGR